jgi:hypothetical protein
VSGAFGTAPLHDDNFAMRLPASGRDPACMVVFERLADMLSNVLRAGYLAFFIAVGTMIPATQALPVPQIGEFFLEGIVPVQFSTSKGFNRCMRAKYGPRYFRGVNRAHRYVMAQACGG